MGRIDAYFYWAVVTISTVGYGDITPVTTGGRLVTTALIISGSGAPCYLTKFRDSCRHNSFTYAADGRCPERPASATTTHKSRFVITTSLAGRLFGMQFLLLSRAASTRRISELPCRLSGTKNHHFAKLRFHDFQRMKNIKLPDYCTPEQTTAVFEFIDEIREAILIQYRLQLMEQMQLERCTEFESTEDIEKRDIPF